jgi:alpha-glucoside transport system permease protein
MTSATATAPTTATAPLPRRRFGSARIARVLQRVPLNVALALVAAIWLVPTFGLLLTSFRPVNESLNSGWWTLFGGSSHFTTQNYQNIFSSGGGVMASLATTLEITLPATILVVLAASLAGYALVFLDWRGRDTVFILLVALMVVPLQLALIPVASLYRVVGLFNTIPGVVLFHAAFGLPFAIFLMRNFYTGIPKDLLEAARIDGANEWMMFMRIVLPLGLPALASLAIFEFLWVWNDLLVALVFLPQAANPPITIFIFSQLRQFGPNLDIISSASFVSMVVPLIVFFSFQRYFVRGVLAGAVK